MRARNMSAWKQNSNTKKRNVTLEQTAIILRERLYIKLRE